jgi:transposase-like protein
MAHYTEAQRAEALAVLKSNNGNLSRTERETGIPKGTLLYWRNNSTYAAPIEMQTQKTESLRGELESVAYRLVRKLAERLNDTDAGVQQLATSLGIVIDKLQLLDGKPTERTAVVNESLTDDERSARIASLFDTARTRRTGSSADDRADWAD